ncbi:MAG TPA: hypothetical protein VE618_06345, partial [Myxococcaceae bacterium]|nr:hypothetical protein [Myxococcaceae bacterium]
MTHSALCGLLAAAIFGSASAHAAPQSTRKYVALSNREQIGTLEATVSGRKVAIDWRIDDNGRGPKLKERIELGASGLPVGWEIEGTAWVGAPVKESFAVQHGVARWKTLDDEGESRAEKSPLYVPNNASPWGLGLGLRAVLATPERRRKALPAGELRA